MMDILYYGAVQLVANEDTLVIEYRFLLNSNPIAVIMNIGREDKVQNTFDEIFNEACNYAYGTYLLPREGRDNS